MKVTREQLTQYNIDSKYFFAIRSGSTNYTDQTLPTYCRDAYFDNYGSQLQTSIYCAIGNDTDGWELEMYNGVNWIVVTLDTNYLLTITNEGLAALTNIKLGGIQFTVSGLKIIDQIVVNPGTPLVTWTDAIFTQAGNVVFSVGTKNSRWQNTGNGNPYLKQLLRWRFNASSGGLQYILSLPADGIGSYADDGSAIWDIGTIGLYIKDPTDYSTDILFAVATLPSIVKKYATSEQVIGNALKFYFNVVLTNLGIVSDLTVLPEADVNLPEVQNETLLTYPMDAKQRPFNCYVVDNLYGTNMPALAVQRKLSSFDPYTVTDQDVNNSFEDIDWAWFQPSSNFISVSASDFHNSVLNYNFVYWDTSANQYKLADGSVKEKMPIGIRIGNSIVFSGTIVNNNTNSYTYTVTISSDIGTNYMVGDELLIPVDANLTFKVRITAITNNGGISNFMTIGPTVGNIPIAGATTSTGSVVLPAVYDPRSQLPRNGQEARFRIQSTYIQNATSWDFSSNLNKPLYCGTGVNAGKPVSTETDSMLGWAISANGIKLHLDLRNEATYDNIGVVKFATNSEVQSLAAGSKDSKAITPETLKTNYLQITLPNSGADKKAGRSITEPIDVNTYVRFNKIVKFTQTVLGKSINTNVIDANIDFYGAAYRAWYQDLAEYYESDILYEPGTLICFGGTKEITAATTECNAIISTKPGFELGDKKGDNWLPVALVGRTPVLFDGNCFPHFGDKIYLSKIKKGRASTIENGKCLGKVIDKDFSPSARLIECVIRMDF